MKSKIIVVVLGVVLFFAGCDKHVVTGIADQVEQVRSAVVHVLRDGVCEGSGCIISKDGIVFTAKHVTEGGIDPSKFTVTLDNGRKFSVWYILEDSWFDVAFLLLKDVKEPLPTVPLSDLSGLRVGDPVFIMGSPSGYFNFNSVSLGIIAAMQRNLDEPKPYGHGWAVTFQSTSPAFPGNSGGPVFDIHGRVIGVLVAVMAPTLNYSVPVAVFIDQVDVVRQAFALMRFHAPIETP
jgi:serine protease Do